MQSEKGLKISSTERSSRANVAHHGSWNDYDGHMQDKDNELPRVVV